MDFDLEALRYENEELKMKLREAKHENSALKELLRNRDYLDAVEVLTNVILVLVFSFCAIWTLWLLT